MRMLGIAVGDHQALEKLYDLYSSYLYSLILGMLRQQELSEEILQDVFIATWKKAGSYSPEKGSVLSWLIRITRNKCIDETRRRDRRPETTDDGVFSFMADDRQKGPEDLIVESWKRKHVLESLNTLGDEEQRCLRLSYFDGLSHGEISELCEYPLGSVKTYIRRGMKNLTKKLKEQLTL